MSNYATIQQLTGGNIGGTELVGYLSNITDPAEIAQITEIIARSSRRIDSYVTSGRESNYFTIPGQNATNRIIRGNNSNVLKLPPHIAGTVTALSSDGVQITSFAKTTSGLVATDENGNFLPELNQATDFALVGVAGGAWMSGDYAFPAHTVQKAFFESGKAYQVNARWGFESVPAEITEACIQLTVRTKRGQDEAFSGVIGSINRDGSIIERGMPAPVKEILDVWKKRYEETRVDWEAV